MSNTTSIIVLDGQVKISIPYHNIGLIELKNINVYIYLNNPINLIDGTVISYIDLKSSTGESALLLYNNLIESMHKNQVFYYKNNIQAATSCYAMTL